MPTKYKNNSGLTAKTIMKYINQTIVIHGMASA